MQTDNLSIRADTGVAGNRGAARRLFFEKTDSFYFDILPIRKGCDGSSQCREQPDKSVVGRKPGCVQFLNESLILAQNERWQRGLGMQVERDEPGSNIGF